jgi:hypothetical protein
LPVHATLAGPVPSLSVHEKPFVTFHASVDDPPTSIVPGVAVNDVIVVSTHRWVPVSQSQEPDVQTLQSEAPVHPHAVPPMHAVPDACPVQMAHVPLAPQAPAAVPSAQVGVACVVSQHPPWHVSPPVQSVEQAWVVVLHASPVGQSLEVVHPHELLTQA